MVMLVQSQRPEPMVVLVPVQRLRRLLQHGQVHVRPGHQATPFRAAYVQATLGGQVMLVQSQRPEPKVVLVVLVPVLWWQL